MIKTSIVISPLYFFDYILFFDALNAINNIDIIQIDIEELNKEKMQYKGVKNKMTIGISETKSISVKLTITVDIEEASTTIQ